MIIATVNVLAQATEDRIGYGGEVRRADVQIAFSEWAHMVTTQEGGDSPDKVMGYVVQVQYELGAIGFKVSY